MIGAASVAALFAAFGAAARYLLDIVVAQSSGSAEYATFAYGATIALIVGTIGAGGLTAVQVRFLPKYEIENKPGKSIALLQLCGPASLMLSCVVALPLVVFREYAGDVASYPAVVVAMVSAPMIAIVAIRRASLQALRRYALMNFTGNALVPTLTLLGVFAVWFCGVPVGASFALLVSAIAGVCAWIVQSVALRSRSALVGKPDWDPEEIKSWARAASALSLVTVCNLAIQRTDLVVLGGIAGVDEIASYAAASRTANLISFVFMAITSVVAPQLARSFASRDTDAVRRMLVRAGVLSVAPAFVFFGLLLVTRNLVFDMFHVDVDVASNVVLILGVGQIVNAATGPVGTFLQVSGHEAILGKILLSAAIANVVLCWSLGNAYGALGVAGATSITTAGWNLAALGVAARTLRSMKDLAA